MKKAVPALAAIGLIILILLGFLGVHLIKKYTPTKELADLNTVYKTSEGLVSVIYNYEMQEAKGIFENNQTYLPLAWVNKNINSRFYWDKGESLLVYALPDQIVYADASTMGSSGAPLLLVKDDDIYLTLGLITSYTNVEILPFDGGEARRVFLADWGTRMVSAVKKNGKLREKGGIKSPIITEIAKGSEVIVLEVLEDWSRVMTGNGHMGYIQSRLLSESSSKEFTGSFKEPVYESTHLSEKITLAWHQVTSMEANSRFPDILDETSGVNVISPTWFALTDNKGGYQSFASKTYVDKAHEMGLQVWALLDNFSDDVSTEVLMSSTANRKTLIDRLMADVEKYDLDGLNMDFEGLPESAGVHYVQFLRELSIPCREKGIVLSVDNYVPANYNQFYDRAEQGVVADYVVIMGYDEHYAGGEAGSVASYEYVKNGIEGMLRDVPKEKIINGVPFYTRLWTETDDGYKSSAIGISKAKEWVEENQVELYWQQELMQFYGDLETEEGTQYIWMEEEKSLSAKMDLIKSYDLAGVACWKLGLEDAAAWEALRWE